LSRGYRQEKKKIAERELSIGGGITEDDGPLSCHSLLPFSKLTRLGRNEALYSYGEMDLNLMTEADV
jgi:hypothetical protein